MKNFYFLFCQVRLPKVLLSLLALLLFASCNNYKREANAFLEKISEERVIATYLDSKRHCIFYLDGEYDGLYNNVLKYDLKTKKSSSIMRNDSGEVPTELEFSWGYEAIDKFAHNNSYIAIASLGRYGSSVMALYDIENNKWKELGVSAVDTIIMTENSVMYMGTSYNWENFGPIYYKEVFNMKGERTEFSLYDKLFDKHYDAEAFINDEDYQFEQFINNLNEYIKSQIISDEDLVRMANENNIKFENEYKNNIVLFHIASIYLNSYAEYTFKYCLKAINVYEILNDIYCYSNDPKIATLQKDDSVILIGKCVNTEPRKLVFHDCWVVDNYIQSDIWDEYVAGSMDGYLEYINSSKTNSY